LAKILKTLHHFCHVCPSLRPHETNGLTLNGFHGILYWESLLRFVDEIQFWLKSGKNGLHFASEYAMHQVRNGAFSLKKHWGR
jgi:hypothetical protein